MSKSQPILGMALGAVLRPSAQVNMNRGEPKGFGIRKVQRKDEGQRYRKHLS